MRAEANNRIGILVSGAGTTLAAARQAELAGKMKARIIFVICNNPPDKAEAWRRANELGLGDAMHLVNNIKFPDKDEPSNGAVTVAAATEILRLAREVYKVRLL